MISVTLRSEKCIALTLAAALPLIGLGQTNNIPGNPAIFDGNIVGKSNFYQDVVVGWRDGLVLQRGDNGYTIGMAPNGYDLQFGNVPGGLSDQAVTMTLTSNGNLLVGGAVSTSGVVFSDGTVQRTALLQGPQGQQGTQGPQGPKGDKGDAGQNGAPGQAGITTITTVAQNYSGSLNLSCAPGYVAVTASCNAGSGVVLNGPSLAPPVGSYVSYLTPSETNSTGVHCDLGNVSLQSQAVLRCAK